MESVSVFDVSGGGVSMAANGALTPAASAQSVTPAKDARMAIRVCNGAPAAVAVGICKGDGPRAVLGKKTVNVPAGQTAYIALFDTARFKRHDGTIAVELSAQDGGALTAEQLSAISIEAVQL